MTAVLVPESPVPVAPEHRSRERLALAGLLLGTAVLYLWDLGASGWANSYYAAAVQAMSQDWTAFLFGSLDTGNVITVDKPPAALWAMALSARLFGFSPWSMLVPQALMGVATVALVHAAVRRVSGPTAGLLAGAAMALTPVAVLMFRFNNPDALLVLLMTAAAYAVVRAVEEAGTRWLVLAGALIGFAFLAKMAQAFLVLPAFVLVYLWAAPTGVWRRVRQLLAAAAAVVVAAGWWIALVELWPAESRPYIGGSESDSALELALGYNGLGRIFGQGGGGGPSAGAPGGALVLNGEPVGGGGAAGGEPFVTGGPGGGGGFGGGAGITRLFNSEIGGQISWLLPAALALLVVGLWLRHRAPRTDPVRASLLLWGGWTVVTGVVFSLMEGIFHAYYTVALAPGIAALVGIGGRELWRRRSSTGGRAALAVVVAGTAAWAFVLLGRTPDVLPWLRWVVIAGGVVAVFLAVVAWRRVGVVLLLAILLTGALGPAAYAVQTAGTAHAGSIPLAGPAVAGAGPGGGRMIRGGPGGGGPGGSGSAGGAPDGGAPDEQAGGPVLMTNGPGGTGDADDVDADLVALLREAGTRWAAAAVGAQSAGNLQLASGEPVIALGGFSGGDPAPTLAEFQGFVAAGEIHYLVAGGGMGGGPGRSGAPEEITAWVGATFASTTVGGQTVYDLTSPLP